MDAAAWTSLVMSIITPFVPVLAIWVIRSRKIPVQNFFIRVLFHKSSDI
jgi:hypothetical protein